MIHLMIALENRVTGMPFVYRAQTVLISHFPWLRLVDSLNGQPQAGQGYSVSVTGKRLRMTYASNAVG